MLGYRRAVYNETSSFVVLSSIGSKFINMYTDDGQLKLDTRKYECKVYDFPSAWFFNGTSWVLRAYPAAMRFRKWQKEDADFNTYDAEGRRLVPDHQGQWYLQDDKNVYQLLYHNQMIIDTDLIIDTNNYILPHLRKKVITDSKLLLHTSVKRRRRRKGKKHMISNVSNIDLSIDNHRSPIFFLSGDVTKMYHISDAGQPMVIKERDTRILNEHSITINDKKDVFGQRVLAAGVCTNTVVNRYTDATVYHFNSVKDANTFYLENKKNFKNAIWKGDLRKPYHFCDPSSGHKILVPRTKFLVDGTLFSMPLEVSDIMMHDDSYDKVGNFFY